MKNASKLTGAVILLSGASSAHALTQYSSSLDFLTPASWSAGSLYTTMQQWDTRPGAETPTTSDNFPWTAAPPVNGSNNTFDNNNRPAGTSLGTPILSITTAFNDTPYLFSGGSPVATVPNYGSGATPVASIYTGTHVIVQLAATQGAEDADGTINGQSVNPGTMQIRSADGSALLAAESTSDSGFLRKTLINAVNSGIPNPVTEAETLMDTWIYEFFVPNYTGGFRVTWNHDYHTVFEAVRIDSALTTGQAFPITPRTLYWDTNGAAAGAGGATPSGSWDGSTQNFNSKQDGSAGFSTAATGVGDIVDFSAGSDATGSYSVTLTAPQTVTGIKIEEGSVTLSGSTLTAGTFDVAAASSAVVSSQVLGAATGASVTKTGAGTLTLASANPYAGGTFVSAGTLLVGHGNALGTGALTINDAVTRAQAGLPKAVSVASVTTTGTGTLDLTNNALVVKASMLAAIDALVTQGYNNGDWLGSGITSSTAATDPNGLTAIGYFDNAEFGATEFEGVTGLDSDDILIKYTYYGDADLNGIVDPDDFNQFLAGFQDPNLPRTWLYGDFDYNNVIDPDDFNLFLAAFQFNGNPLSELVSSIEMSSLSSADQQLLLGAVAAVPEPGALGVLAFAACGLAARRRRAS